MRSLDDIEALIAFFEARSGQVYGFRWKDWSDFKSSKASAEVAFDDQVIGVGDGATSAFPLVKNYLSGPVSYTRPIKKPVAGTVRVGVGVNELQEGTDYQVDFASGQVVFTSAPDVDESIVAGFEFDVPVRFDTETIQTSMASFRAGEVPNVPVVELRI